MKKKFLYAIVGIILVIGLVLVAVQLQGNETANGSSIIGDWKAEVEHSHGDEAHSEMKAFSFLENGTFIYSETDHGETGSIEGKFSTSNGKIYLKEITSIQTHDKQDDETVEYQLGSDIDGKYLKIGDTYFRKKS